jgi:anti-sigma factor RsiW
MSRCYHDGALRASIDQMLPRADQIELADHLAHCPICQTRLDALHALHTTTMALLGPSAAPSDPQAAWQRFTARHSLHAPTQSVQRRSTFGGIPMTTSFRTWFSMRRPLVAGVSALALALCLLAVPPVRAAADHLLQVFRVQQVMFLPFSEERANDLDQLETKESPFVSVEAADEDWKPQRVSGPAEAETAIGYPLHQPTVFPIDPSQREFKVRGSNTLQFEVDVAVLREALMLLGINDVTLPDALGEGPVRVDMPAHAVTTYRHDDNDTGYSLTLFQGQSPEITLPDGVDMAQLGKAMLRVYGMSPVEAEAMSQQIDWNSTLVVPFPTDLGNDEAARQVAVNGANGLLISDNDPSRSQALYWQDGDRFYVLTSSGVITPDALIAIAESIR